MAAARFVRTSSVVADPAAGRFRGSIANFGLGEFSRRPFPLPNGSWRPLDRVAGVAAFERFFIRFWPGRRWQVRQEAPTARQIVDIRLLCVIHTGRRGTGDPCRGLFDNLNEAEARGMREVSTRGARRMVRNRCAGDPLTPALSPSEGEREGGRTRVAQTVGHRYCGEPHTHALPSEATVLRGKLDFIIFGRVKRRRKRNGRLESRPHRQAGKPALRDLALSEGRGGKPTPSSANFAGKLQNRG